MGNTDSVLKWSTLIPLVKSQVEGLSLGGIEGVYRISKKENDDKFYVVLIGSATDLNTELLKQISRAEFSKQSGEFSFRYAPVTGEEMRKAIEKQMYKQYVPRFNPTEPQSTLEVKVNLN
jgi:hypothetical protein